MDKVLSIEKMPLHIRISIEQDLFGKNSYGDMEKEYTELIRNNELFRKSLVEDCVHKKELTSFEAYAIALEKGLNVKNIVAINGYGRNGEFKVIKGRVKREGNFIDTQSFLDFLNYKLNRLQNKKLKVIDSNFAKKEVKKVDYLLPHMESLYNLTKQDAMKRLIEEGISESEQMLNKWCRDGLISAVRVSKGAPNNRGIRISEKSLNTFIAKKNGHVDVLANMLDKKNIEIKRLFSYKLLLS